MHDPADDASLFGTVRTALGPGDLAPALARAGVAAEARESANYAGGRYVRLYPPGEADGALERVADAEYLVRGGAGKMGALTALARALSAALGALGIVHRLEVYADGADEPAAYVHHEWPRDS